MRPITWVTAAAVDTDADAKTAGTAKPSTKPAPVAVGSTLPKPDFSLGLADIKNKAPSLRDKVIFRMNLGFGLDGAQPSGQPLRSGATLDRTDNYAQLRIYGFGDAVIGTKGLGAPSLNSYFASQFRFDKKTNRPSSGVPSVYDSLGERNVLVRSGYAEVDGMFKHKLLKPLFLKAGRQYRYGPAVAHFDGVSVGWQNAAATVSFFGGRRVSLYTFDQSEFIENGGLIAGNKLRIDMFQLKEVPLVIDGSTFLYDDTVHFDGGITFRWSKEVLMGLSFRILGNNFARQRLQLRARVSKTSTIKFDIENRSADDWTYDMIVQDPEHDTTDSRRWLSLGKPLPRLYLNLRAGTVWLKNFDLLFRAGAAIETRDSQIDQPSAFSANYVDIGGAFEARIRRAVAIGASLLVRQFSREKAMITSVTDGPDDLPDHSGYLGERSFYEGGVTVRFSRATGSFSATSELYQRSYRPSSPFESEFVGGVERHFGGRFSIFGYVDKRLRLRAEYDTAFAPNVEAPELRGIKSLRLMMEGSF